MHRTICLSLLAASFLVSPGCVPADAPIEPGTMGGPALGFESVTVSETANLWWAHDAADLNGDGLLDVALQDDNGHGGWLGWLEARDGGRSWRQHVIAETVPNGETFAGGDLQTGDIDRDGDPDVVAFAHPGEWDEAGAPTTLYWYENGSDGWTPRKIGSVPAFVKDVNVVDFNGDSRLDVVTITYVRNIMTVFRQDGPAAWAKVQEFTVENLHEGMDVGDIDGDGDQDLFRLPSHDAETFELLLNQIR